MFFYLTRTVVFKFIHIRKQIKNLNIFTYCSILITIITLLLSLDSRHIMQFSLLTWSRQIVTFITVCAVFTAGNNYNGQ